MTKLEALKYVTELIEQVEQYMKIVDHDTFNKLKIKYETLVQMKGVIRGIKVD